ncbi:MAG: ABC transporter ATP-binding protein [Desulfocurvibacter africanus]
MYELPKIQGQPALVVDSLGKSFRGKIALDSVSFTVPEASLTVILGAAGAGKTTTLRLIAGLDQADSGRILMSGRDVGKWEPKDRNIAMILDSLALYPNKTGFQNIASPLAIRGEPREVIERKVTELAAVLKVSHTLQRLPKTMSGGERQRIALGRALIRTPSLFLLDEPLSSLDAMLRIELRAELKRLQRERGFSFLLATPDFNEAMAIADTVVMLREGRVVQIDRPQTLYDEPVDREVARFVGAPQINIVPAGFEPGSDGGLMQAAGSLLPVPAHLREVLAANPRTFELGIRPESLRLAATSGASIAAELIDIEPLGLKSVLTVRNDAAELRILVASNETHGLSLGQSVGVEAINTGLMLAFDPVTGRRLVR